MIIFLAIVFLLLSFTALAIAAYCSAVQDTVLHHFDASVFNQPLNVTRKFGFLWNWWYRSDWKNKWMTDENGELILDKYGNRIPRLTKILFWKFQFVQIYDAWHYYKMLNIGFNIIADILASAAAVCVYIALSPSIPIWIGLALVYFILQSIVWNYFFNNYYEDWLLKAEAKFTLQFKRR